MGRKRHKIGEILCSWHLLTEEQLKEALKIAQGSQRRLGDLLVELGYCKETDVAKALASQYGMAYIDPEASDAVSADVIRSGQLMPLELVKKFLVLPLEKKGGKLKVLIHDPIDLELLDNLRFRMGCEIELALAARGSIKRYLDALLREDRGSIDQAVRELSRDTSRDTSIDIKGLTIDHGASTDRGASIDVSGKRAEADDAPIIRLINQIISEAVNTRASDIHVEPMGDRLQLRYRIDGVCHVRDRIPKRNQGAIIARLKLMAGMKIEEKRAPQDGRIKLRIGEGTVDFRVSACPAYHGESVVLRVLRADAVRLGLEKLGFQPDTLEQFNQIIRRPNGIFLVTGPTGSGKTTSLYSALSVLNRPDKKIITAEDPVEYNFKGINQCQVNESIGLNFSKILRAMLRQAPNIVLVGEIRDKEVADVAIQAALTGHLVFSTLRTNDAPSAITRLVDMGVKPFLVASSIQAVLAQRLVRILCDKCKQPVTNPSRKLLRICGFAPEDVEGHTLYRAVGCGQCSHTGYRGRRGIYEMMTMNSELRELAFKRAPLNQVRNAAYNTGMRNLLGDGRLKILAGESTLEEISRIAQVQGVVEDDEDADAA